jgi:hypothetical protein
MKKNGFYFLVTLILLVLFIGEIALLYFYSQKPWYDRLGFVLQIIGFYGVGLGFIQRTEALKNFAGLDEINSPDPVRFIRGNFIFLSQFFLIASIGFDSKRSSSSSMALGCLGRVLLLVLSPFLFLYALVHLLLICPPAYFAYLITNAIVESITGASGDIVMESTEADGKIESIKMKEVITSNRAAAISFLIGIPATILSLITKGFGMFLG